MTQQPEDINLLAAQIHANSIQHGFWSQHTVAEHHLCLVVCELAEAVEAHRKNNMGIQYNPASTKVSYPDFYPTAIQADGQPESEWVSWFEQYIKDSVGDELADAVIRLLDLASANYTNIATTNAISPISIKQPFTENVWLVMRVLADNDWTLDEQVCIGLCWVLQLAEAYSIDIWRHVFLKCKYNTSRPYMHGKQY